MLRFTLQALAITVLLAAVAVPMLMPGPLVCGPINGNESAAIATLKNLSSAQQEFARLRAVDLDGDGRGEFGAFGELSGAAMLREQSWRSGPSRRLATPLLSAAFGSPIAGRVQRSGYCFQIWLQTAGGAWCGSDAARGPTEHWCAYAWPADEAGKARRAFFVDDHCGVWATLNRDLRYLGTECPVPIDAALPSSDAAAESASSARIGRDGQTWVGVN